jgi:hypothetical protein
MRERMRKFMDEVRNGYFMNVRFLAAVITELSREQGAAVFTGNIFRHAQI